MLRTWNKDSAETVITGLLKSATIENITNDLHKSDNGNLY